MTARPTIRFALLALVLGAATILPTAANVSAQGTRWDLSGKWLASGTDADGSAYKDIPVTITSFGDATYGGYKVTWTYADRKVTGIGNDVNNVLGVGYKDASSTGVALYVVKNSGNTLDGTWIEEGFNKEKAEVLIRQ